MNTSSAFHMVVRWHISGDVDKFDRVILKKKQKCGSFLDTVYMNS